MTQANDIVQAYFDAWDAHDPEAILDLFSPQGTYQDSSTGEALSGQKIADYAQSLFTAFPDLKLELVCNQMTSTGVVAAAWILFGTHQGPLGELAATNRKVALEGCDFVSVKDGKIEAVRGLFSPEALIASLS